MFGSSRRNSRTKSVDRAADATSILLQLCREKDEKCRRAGERERSSQGAGNWKQALIGS